MKTLRTPLIVPILLFLLSSCSSIMVSYDYDPDFAFKSFQTFALEAKDPDRKTDPRADNDLLNKRFNNTIVSELQEKGYTTTDAVEHSDFTVAYHYSIGPKIDFSNISTQIGFSHGSYRRYGGVGARTCTDFSKYDQGILHIDIIDNQTNTQIWRGTATDIVSIHSTPEEITSQVEKIVSKVLKKFPPQS